jgi:hypothetical protein
MLALRFSIHIKMKLKGKCPKHPRFNPEIGQGAIRGGCRECLAPYQVVAARDQAAAALRRNSPSHIGCSQTHALEEVRSAR